MNPTDWKDETADFSRLKMAQQFHKTRNNELWEALDLLQLNAERMHENLANSQNHIKQWLDETGMKSVTVEYARLKEQFNELQARYLQLYEKYERAERDRDTQLEELQKRHGEELEKLNADYTQKKCEFDESIVKLKEEHEIKEEEYFHDVHATQAESALRFDEMESRMQKLLDESNRKIRELNNSNNVLRAEMMTLKSDYTTANTTKIKELESRLVISENQRRIAESKLQQRAPTPASTRGHGKSVPPALVTKTNQTTAVMMNDKDPVDKATVNLYKETKRTCWMRRKTHDVEPPNVVRAQQESNVAMTTVYTNTVKRRKLYSLNDVENLESPD